MSGENLQALVALIIVLTFVLGLIGALLIFIDSCSSIKEAKTILFKKHDNLTKFGSYTRFVLLIPGFCAFVVMLFIRKLFLKD